MFHWANVFTVLLLRLLVALSVLRNVLLLETTVDHSVLPKKMVVLSLYSSNQTLSEGRKQHAQIDLICVLLHVFFLFEEVSSEGIRKVGQNHLGSIALHFLAVLGEVLSHY